MIHPCIPPRGLFRGANFMTPDVLACYRLRRGYAEISQGTGISRQPIFGVTVRPKDAPSRSQLFQSLAAARAYVEELS